VSSPRLQILIGPLVTLVTVSVIALIDRNVAPVPNPADQGFYGSWASGSDEFTKVA
jgi:hypothetical protein